MIQGENGEIMEEEMKKIRTEDKKEIRAEKKRAKKAKREKRLASKGGFAVRLVCFIILMGSIMSYSAYVLTPKNEYGICPMMNYYQQPADTVDVLVVGSSLAYSGCNTNVLWRVYGVACYNLCGAEEAFWSTYYELKEAISVQRPKMILLDAKAASYSVDYSKRGRTIQATYGILNPINRFNGIFASQESARDSMGFFLKYPQVHYKYTELKWEDFLFPPTNEGRGPSWKGYIETDKVEEHDEYAITQTSQKKELRPRAEEYVRKIFELAKEEDIPLTVVAFPNPDYSHDQPYYNTLWDIAAEYGISHIDYNNSYRVIGLNFYEDFADWQHLNVRGSIKMSLKLGYDLSHDFNMPDHRGDPAFESYEECAEIWFDKMYSFTTSPVQGAFSAYGL